MIKYKSLGAACISDAMMYQMMTIIMIILLLL